jgi:hypothetical protein
MITGYAIYYRKKEPNLKKKNSVMHCEENLSLESERWIYFDQSIEFTEF